MIREILSCLLVLTFSLNAQQVAAPPGGTLITDFSQAKVHVAGPMGSSKKSGDHWEITVSTANKTRAFDAQLSWPFLKGSIARDEPLLVIVRARSTDGNPGNLKAKIQLTKPQFTAVTQETAFNISAAWNDYPIVFRPSRDLPDGVGAIILFAGHLKQQIEIESVNVIRYPNGTDVSNFPKIKHTYLGREMDAPWRKAALERIEKLRKNDLTLTLLDSNGKPLANKKVRLTQTRSEFGFGTAVSAQLLTADTPDAKKYREIIERNFSMITFENDLKDMFWGADKSPQKKEELKQQLNEAFKWTHERGIKVRGHYLIQMAKPTNLQNVSDPDEIRRHFIATTNERLAFVGDRVCEWDVINHPVAWGGADMLTKFDSLRQFDREIYKLSRTQTALPFYVNEDQIFRPGRQTDDTYHYIESLIRDGMPVDGLGNQGHFDASFLPSMENIMQVTDRYAQLVPHQIITEFDIKTGDDEALAADYTRDLLIACYSHPAYRGFIFWGFWQGRHWIKECASWNLDWSTRGRGEVIDEWIGKRWRTNLETSTDALGQIHWRGFPGRYRMDSDGLSAPLTFDATTLAPAPKVRITP